MFLLRSNVLPNLCQISGAVRAIANMNHRAQTVTDAARWQVQRFVSWHYAVLHAPLDEAILLLACSRLLHTRARHDS